MTNDKLYKIFNNYISSSIIDQIDLRSSALIEKYNHKNEYKNIEKSVNVSSSIFEQIYLRTNELIEKFNHKNEYQNIEKSVRIFLYNTVCEMIVSASGTRNVVSEKNQSAIKHDRIGLEYNTLLTNRLLSIMIEDDLDFSFTSKAEVYVRELLSENPAAVREWLNDIFLSNFESTNIIKGILHIIYHLPYEIIYPEGPTMAIAALTHSNIEIKEYGIRCFESWGNKHSLHVLKKIDCPQQWLREYVTEIITYLERELG
jgi:hypothetical protein